MFGIFDCSRTKSLALDPSDKKWQRSEEYPPDKEQSWDDARPFYRDQWHLSNNALRSELKDLHSAISAITNRDDLQPWEVKSLRPAWQIHWNHVTSKFKEKDQVVNPFIEQRVKLESTGSEARLQIRDLLDAVNKLISSLDGSKDPHRVLKAYEKYQEQMLQHLGDEESTELLLLRAYFAPEEVEPIAQELRGSTSDAIGSLIFSAGNDTFSEFMIQEKISNFQWYWELRGQRNRFERDFVQPLDLVTKGVAPCNCSVC